MLGAIVRAVGCGIIQPVTRWTNLTPNATDEDPASRTPVGTRRSAGAPFIRVQPLFGPRVGGPERILRGGRVRAGARTRVAHRAARAGRQYAGRRRTRDSARPRLLSLRLPGRDYGCLPGAWLGRRARRLAPHKSLVRGSRYYERADSLDHRRRTRFLGHNLRASRLRGAGAQVLLHSEGRGRIALD